MTEPAANPSIQLINEAGETKDFHPDQVADAYLSGKWTAPLGTPIPVTAGGAATTVPIENLAATLKEGAAVISHQDLRKAQLQEQYGGLGSQVENAATQALSGATLGTSDMLIGALAGKGTRQAIRERAEANPIGTTVSKIAGAIAPLIATGGAAAPEEAAALGATEGASALATAGELGAAAAPEAASLGSQVLGGARAAITAPQNLLTKVGDIAEGAVGHLLPEEATSLAGKLAIKAASTGVRGAAEGGAIGGTDYLSEAALSDDHQLDGEKLLASIGHGAILGGLGGAGIGVAGELGSAAIDRLAPKIARQAEDSAASAITGGQNAKIGQKIDSLPGGKQGLGRLLIDDGLIKAGDSVTEIAPRITAAREAAGAEIGNLRRTLDEAGVEGPSLQGLHEALDKGVLSRLEEMPGLNSAAINKIQVLKEDVARMAGAAETRVAEPTFEAAQSFLKTPEGKQALSEALRKDGVGTTQALAKGEIPGMIRTAMGAGEAVSPRLTFDQVAKLRGRIDDAINYTRDPFGKVDATGDALIKARGALEDELTRAADSGARKLGQEDWLDKYEAAKLKYRQLTVADEAATKSAQSKLKNRKLSLSDYLAGSSIAAGHLAAGNPLGAVAGAASAMVHKAIRERGSATTAVLLDKIGAMSAVQRATARVDRQMTRGVDAAMGRETAALKAPMAHGLETFEDKREALDNVAKDMAGHDAAVRGAVSGIAQHAPAMAASFSEASMRATAYLLNALPKSQPSNPLMPHVDRLEPSDHEKLAFTRVFDAVHDPPSVLVDVGRCTVTPEQVNALAATHPKLKADMDKRLLAAMQEATEPLAIGRAVAVSMFLGQPASPNLSPESVSGYQATFAALPKKPGPEQVGHERHSGVKSAMKDMSFASDTGLPGQKSASA